MPPKLCRPPIVVDRVLDDPSVVRELVVRGSPYFTVQRYLKNHDEMTSLSDAGKRGKPDADMFIAPWFRGDWVYDVPLLSGVEPFFENPRFVDAARALFGAPIAVPQIVYVNLNPPMPQVDPGHVDIPAFRGVDRTTTPVWLLAIMLKSGLFDRWYVPMATAVAWYYEGPGGGFRYWPDGPDRAPIDRPCLANTAVVGDNDHMFHCVHAIGEQPKLRRGLTLDTQLVCLGDTYEIRDGDQVLGTFPWESVRISVSWKAMLFGSEREQRVYVERTDDLSLAEVERIFLEDLAKRGEDATPPDDVTSDRRFINLLNRVYGYSPTVFA